MLGGRVFGANQCQESDRHLHRDRVQSTGLVTCNYDRIFACNARLEQCTAASARARRRYPPRCLPLLAAELTRFTVRLRPSVSPAGRQTQSYDLD
jgi:hypothetical protein